MARKLSKLRLIAPSREMKRQIMAFRWEFFAQGEQKIYGSCGLHHYEIFEDWLRDIRRAAEGCPVDQLPSSTFFALRLSDNCLVGTVNIRHYLNEANYHNGHIGYAVRPSERRKGYGTEMLRLALIKAEQLGILDTVVSCNKGNKGSQGVIENNGLRFEREFLEDNGHIVLVYHTL